jgi:hypothetical protein
MRSIAALSIALTLALAMVPVAHAQPGMKSPKIPWLFQPVIGTGTVYEMTTAGAPKSMMTYALVGKEDFEGQEAWWLEMRFDPGEGGEMVMKQLAVIPPKGLPEPKRMIIQSGGMPAQEMPPEMVSSIGQRVRAEADKEGLGEKIETETITVPAGSFECEHYRMTKGAWKADIWFSRDVRPNGLVRMVSTDAQMSLVKVLTNETSHIKGTPQRMPALPGGFPPGALPPGAPAPGR